MTRANTPQLIAGLLAAMLLMPLAMTVQADGSQPQPVQGDSQFSPEQLEQMLAPIALYPDPLLAQILMASTYPLEVVQADRWIHEGNNAGLRGDRLNAALEQQPWDPSVKSLVPFPQILRMMDNNLTWTEQLGDAFLAQQPMLMDSVQRLRQQARAAGRLQSTSQEVIAYDGPVITIEPPNPQVVFVPVYDPGVVYGSWAYPDYPPYYFPGYFGGGFAGSFGYSWVSVGIYAPLWGWGRWDWHRHQIAIDNHRFNAINGNRPGPGMNSGVWHHDPAHRGGVPYRDPGTRARFMGAQGSPDARRGFRGYPAGAPAQFHANGNAGDVHANGGHGQPGQNAGQGAAGHEVIGHAQPQHGAEHANSGEHVIAEQGHVGGGSGGHEQGGFSANAGAGAEFHGGGERGFEAQHAPSPTSESFGRGVDVRMQSERGHSSRQSMPAMSAMSEHHANGGGGGGPRPGGGGGPRPGGGGGGRKH